MIDLEQFIENEIIKGQHNRPTIVFAESQDPRVIEAACYLTRFCRPVFLDTEERIRKVIEAEMPGLDRTRADFTLSHSAFVDIPSRGDLIEEMVPLVMKCERESAPGPDKARKLLSGPQRFGIYLVRAGHADMVVGGARFEPKDFFRPALRVLKQQDIQCEAGVFVLPDDYPAGIVPHNIVVFGDVGVNATMTPEVLAHIAVGTCAIARDVIPESILPEINGAIVSYSNKGSDEGPSPELVRKATALIPDILAERALLGERYKSIRIEGEVKVSAAFSKRSAAHYFHKDKKAEELAGKFSVIIAPNLELGNFLFHIYSSRYPDSKKFAAMFGLRFRMVDIAMDCTTEDIILGVKANLLRHHSFGHWKETPRDTFFKRHRVLAINPGSTSTKIALYEGEMERWVKEISHGAEELKPFAGKPMVEQRFFRKEIIVSKMKEMGYGLEDLDAIAARGGLLDPIPGGTYEITPKMIDLLMAAKNGEHASNLGAIIAEELRKEAGLRAYVVDPVVVDEVPERAKITGVREIKRKTISHALNQIASARRYAEESETFYEKVNVIVCHMGGGISVGAHCRGRYIDVLNALDGEGPFTPERSGTLPVGALIELCFSGKYTKQELKVLNKGRGGLISLLGTSDLREVEKRIDAGDEEAAVVFEAMAYQIAKEISSKIPAFDGEKVERVILTGGMARSKRLVEAIKGYLSAMDCGVTVYPGENEMLALTKGVLRVLSGKENAKTY